MNACGPTSEPIVTAAPDKTVSSLESPIAVHYPEVYELANIVLALTNYGLTDPWQVRKDFDYYERMRAWFDPMLGHPLLDAVDYSKERWQEFLSFRTDAYAFIFDDAGRLVRTSDFRAFEISAFDDHLELVEDFARQSRFREFFAANSDFRNEVVSRYRDSYMLQEMRTFLAAQFGDYFSDSRYAVALSPFVYAQNLHRNVSEKLTVDFPTVAPSILTGTPMVVSEQVSEIHTLFTEMSHGYVNPVTDRNADAVAAAFDGNVWGAESGYEAYPNAVFNEYMTWAVYDIFVREHFPKDYALPVLNWHRQNETRNFPYSGYFGKVLLDVYDAANSDGRTATLRDIYPVLLERLSERQDSLVKPSVTNSDEVIIVPAGEPNWIGFDFDVPLNPSPVVEVQVINGDAQETLRLEGETVRWNEDGTRLELWLAMDPSVSERHGLLLNAWETQPALETPDGVMLSMNSYRLATIAEFR